MKLFESERAYRLGLFLIAIAGTIVYLPAIGDFLLADDPLMIFISRIHSMSDFFRILTQPEGGSSFYRPIINLVYALEYPFFGANGTGYHIINLLFHLANSVLVCLIGTKISGRRLVGFASGLLFSVMAIHVQSVVWISGRTDLVCALFLLGSFYLVVGSGRVGSWSVVLFALSLLAKEASLAFPLAVFAYFGIHRKEGIGRSAVRSSPLLVPVFAWLVVRFSFHGGFTFPVRMYDPLSLLSDGRLLAADVMAAGANFLNMLLPVVTPREIVPFVLMRGWDGVPLWWWAVAAGAVVLPAAFAFRFRQVKGVAFGLAFSAVMLLPGIHVLYNYGGSWYFYIPSAGFAVFVASSVPAIASRFTFKSGPASVMRPLFIGCGFAVLVGLQVSYGTRDVLRWRSTGKAVADITQKALDIYRDAPEHSEIILRGLPENSSFNIYMFPGWSRQFYLSTMAQMKAGEKLTIGDIAGTTRLLDGADAYPGFLVYDFVDDGFVRRTFDFDEIVSWSGKQVRHAWTCSGTARWEEAAFQCRQVSEPDSQDGSAVFDTKAQAPRELAELRRVRRGGGAQDSAVSVSIFGSDPNLLSPRLSGIPRSFMLEIDYRLEPSSPNLVTTGELLLGKSGIEMPAGRAGYELPGGGFYIYADGKQHRARIIVERPRPFSGHLRIDPGSLPGRLSIYRIAIYSAQGTSGRSGSTAARG